MKAWQIFMHSVRQVTGNFESALKISLIPTLIMTVASVLLLGGAGLMAPDDGIESPGAVAGISLGLIVMLIVLIAGSMWIAVNWHRFVLLGEAPQGCVPTFRGDRVWAYFRRSIGMFLVLIAASLLLTLIGGLVGALFGRLFGEGGLIISLALIVWLSMVLLGYRLTISLPGAALGSELGLMAGLNATKDDNVTIFLLALISVFATLALGMLGGLLSAIPVLGTGIGFLSQWLVTMVGLSILTTLYGHYVEGRALS